MVLNVSRTMAYAGEDLSSTSIPGLRNKVAISVTEAILGEGEFNKTGYVTDRGSTS